ncbi:hypothetical protein [Dongshaea marina]|uniref:hypothetical protein n=1 Tax=Dongshaea marina TaxID=2047966 RepID=UPI000D3EBCDB|nr:hypothetical protein [Dongshaea marina]
MSFTLPNRYQLSCAALILCSLGMTFAASAGENPFEGVRGIYTVLNDSELLSALDSCQLPEEAGVRIIAMAITE